MKAPLQMERIGEHYRMWVCTRCCKESFSIRARFAWENCPRCENPGSGMVLAQATEGEVKRFRAGPDWDHDRGDALDRKLERGY